MSAELDGPVVPVGQSKYNDPLLMALAKSALDMTETEIYIAEGGIPEELLTARKLEGQGSGDRASVPSDTASEGPRKLEQGRQAPGEGAGLETSPIKEEEVHNIMSSPTDMAGKSLLEVETIIEAIERTKANAKENEKIRWDCWALKIQGYTVDAVARQYDVSTQLIYMYWAWCAKQLPELQQQMEEFTRVTVLRLETQYRQLAIARYKGDLMAHKVSLDLLDQQGKLLGVHKMQVQVDNRVTYVLEGVDMDAL